MAAIYELVPVIADVISTHCPGTAARERFVRACLGADWEEARHMMDGMLAEPWHLQGHQEKRLREFIELIADGRQTFEGGDTLKFVNVNLTHNLSPNSSPRLRLASRHAGHFSLTQDVDRPER